MAPAAAGTGVPPMSEQRLICTFFLNGACFGLRVEQVQEVILDQPMTFVPLAQDTVGGLMNLRGQIVTVLDMRRVLRMPPRKTDAEPMNVVVRTSGDTVSLLVDEIGDVIDVDGLELEPAPETLAVRTRELIAGVYALPDELLLLLNTRAFLETAPPVEGGDTLDLH